MTYIDEVKSNVDKSTIGASLYLFSDAQPDFSVIPQGNILINGGLPTTARSMGQKWASLEEGRVTLDGTAVWPNQSSPDALKRLGIWYGTIANDLGTFSPFPVLDIEFTNETDVDSMSIIFDDMGEEYAVFMTLEYKDGNGSTLRREEVDNGSPTFSHSVGLEKVKTIQVRILAWNKVYRVAKVCNVLFGSTYEITSDDIYKFTISEEIAPFSSAMPIPQATLVLDNSDNRWDVLNPSSIAANFREAMRIFVYMNVGGERVDCSQWYLSEWSNDNEDLTASLVMKPKIVFAGTYTSDSPKQNTVARVVQKIINGFVTYEIGDGLGSIVINEGLNNEIDLASALQQIANAVGGVWKIGRDNVYRLVKYSNVPTYRTISTDDIFTAPTIEQQPNISKISLKYTDVEVNEDGETNFTSREFINQFNGNVGATIDLISNFVADEITAEEATRAMYTQYSKYRLAFTFEIKGDPKLTPLTSLYTQLPQGDVSVHVTSVTTTYSDDILTTRVEGVGLLTEASFDALYSGAAYAGGYIG